MILSGEARGMRDRTCRRKKVEPNPDAKSLEQIKREHAEAMAYAKECQALAKQREEQEHVNEEKRQNTIPYAYDTLTDVPVKERASLRKQRLESVKQLIQEEKKQTKENSNNNKPKKKPEPAHIQALREDARDRAASKTLKELKQACKDRDINTDSFVDKNDYMEAWVDYTIALKLKVMASST